MEIAPVTLPLIQQESSAHFEIFLDLCEELETDLKEGDEGLTGVNSNSRSVSWVEEVEMSDFQASAKDAWRKFKMVAQDNHKEVVFDDDNSTIKVTNKTKDAGHWITLQRKGLKIVVKLSIKATNSSDYEILNNDEEEASGSNPTTINDG
uniref:Uncharacterized protein n=1 Tax=Cannabis sativa TaxID=3483 RepID=A0A803P1D0_CANSA